MDVLGYRAFSTELLKIATEVRDPDIRAMNAEARGKEYLQGGQLPANSEFETNFKPKLAAAFVVDSKGPIGMNSPYERASNYVGSALKGGMTGAGAGALLHTIRHGHDLNPSRFHLGGWAAAGAGIGLADHALRHHFKMQRLHQMEGQPKLAMFSPAQHLASTQSVGTFENTLHKTPLKAPKTMIGRDFRLPPQGA